MNLNAYTELHAAARAANDLDAVREATLARDLYAIGATRVAESHARVATARLGTLERASQEMAEADLHRRPDDAMRAALVLMGGPVLRRGD